MKLKKLLALALAGVMTLALLTSCGGKSDDALRAEALADLINVREGVNITCKADPQLNEAAQRFTQVRVAEGGDYYINYLMSFNLASCGPQALDALLDTIGIDPSATDKQVIFYYGIDRGSDDPVKQAIDLCDQYRQIRPTPDYDTWGHPNFLASSYRVGFGSWTDKDNIPHLFVIMVGDIPARS